MTRKKVCGAHCLVEEPTPPACYSADNVGWRLMKTGVKVKRLHHKQLNISHQKLIPSFQLGGKGLDKMLCLIKERTLTLKKNIWQKSYEIL